MRKSITRLTRLKGRFKQVTERNYYSESNTDSLPHLKHKPFGTGIYRLNTSGRLVRRTADAGRYGTEVYQYRYLGDTVIRTLYHNKHFQRRSITTQSRDGQDRAGQVRYFVEDDRGIQPLAMVSNKYDTLGRLIAQLHYGASGKQYAEMRCETMSAAITS